LNKQEKTIDVTSLGQLVNVRKFNVNVDQELIMITEDRAKLCLMKYLEDMGKRDSWTTPFAILLTVVVTLSSTSFKQFVVGADVWQAIFLIVGGLSVLWLANSLRKRPKAKKIEDVITELEAATRNNEAPPSSARLSIGALFKACDNAYTFPSANCQVQLIQSDLPSCIQNQCVLVE
jgi:hypothetical protein